MITLSGGRRAALEPTRAVRVCNPIDRGARSTIDPIDGRPLEIALRGRVVIGAVAGQAVPFGVKAVAVAITAFVYVLPSVIGYLRRIRNLGSVVLLNLALGWSLIGWFVALGMATRSAPRGPHYS